MSPQTYSGMSSVSALSQVQEIDDYVALIAEAFIFPLVLETALLGEHIRMLATYSVANLTGAAFFTILIFMSSHVLL